MPSKAYRLLRLVGEYVRVRAVFEYVSRGLSLWTGSLVRKKNLSCSVAFQVFLWPVLWSVFLVTKVCHGHGD